MDGDNNKSEVVDGERTTTSFRVLKRLDPTKVLPEDLLKLWQDIIREPYNTDDFGEANPEFWIRKLFDPTTEHYVGGNMYVAVVSVIPYLSAEVHYASLGVVNLGALRELTYDLFAHLFETYRLNRLNAFIPALNKEALRLATLSGFKYEGEMRGMYLRHEKYHNLQVWGLTKADFAQRRR